jgi:hypothetical protein
MGSQHVADPSCEDDTISERTPLLASQQQQAPQALHQGGPASRSPQSRPYDTDEDDELDVHESELLLARTASISSAVGLAPEAPEGVMFQHRQRKMSTSTARAYEEEDDDDDREPTTPGYDLEEGAPLLGQAKSERQYLINTNYPLFITIFLTLMLGNFISIFDGTIMASSHPV